MGRPYREELECLPASLRWASTADVTSLAAGLDSLSGRQLLAIGSGGSFVAAVFATMLYEAFFGKLAKPITPLEAAMWPSSTDAGALLLSARGNNPDILDAFRQLAYRGQWRVAVVCARVGSPLSRLAQASGHEAFEFELPTGRDGYLATNSLIATLILLYRAFALAAGQVPSDTTKLLTLGERPEQWIADWPLAEHVMSKGTVLVLFQGWARTAAVDLESRFVEAALGNVSVTDYRNFAHGRHHWLDKRGQTSAVVSLETPESRTVADQTLVLLPSDTAVMRIQSSFTDALGSIDLVRSTMALTLAAAEAVGTDPGRPTVAQFGRRLYHSRSLVRRPTALEKWVGLKARALGLAPRASVAPIERALENYLDRLGSATFRGLVADYDGTLCAADRRYSRLHPKITAELNRLLAAGLKLGIATGRGRSAHAELRDALLPEYWSSVALGLYNGDVLVRLDEDPPAPEPAAAEILLAAQILQPVSDLLDLKLVLRHRQISVRPAREGGLDLLQSVVTECLRRSGSKMRVVRSSHSLDVLMPGVSKSSVVKRVEDMLRDPSAGGEILRIGDRGSHLGNDFELLSSGLSLSVDEVSADLNSCWNLSPDGTRGDVATREYLRAIVESPKGLRMFPSALLRPATQ